jgi:hypothetical protein
MYETADFQVKVEFLLVLKGESQVIVKEAIKCDKVLLNKIAMHISVL